MVPTLLQEPAQAQIQDPKIDEKDLRIVLKGLEPTAEIVSFTTFAYPVYDVSYATPETQRTLVIDGVGGGIIDA